MGRALEGFHEQVTRQLTRKIHNPLQRLDGRWEYTSTEAARVEVGFEKMETYSRRSQNTVAQYIATVSIMDLCEAAERK